MTPPRTSIPVDAPHASETGSDPASRMLVAAAEVFTKDGRPSERTVQQFREAFYSVIERCDTASRTKASNLLSRATHCPRAVALFLAMDAPVVAMPMLRHSTVLGALDLAQIASHRGPIHQRLIAGRADLPDAVVRTLAATGDRDVAAALLANRTITLDRDLRDVLGGEPETRSAEAVATPAATATVRMRDGARDRLDEALARSRRTPVTKPTPEHEVLDDRTFAERLERAAYLRDRRAMTAALQGRWNVTRASCDLVLQDHTGDALNVAMKAAGIDADQAHRIVLLAVTAVGLSVRGAQRAMDVYARLKQESCLKAVAAWPKDEALEAAANGSAGARLAPTAQDADGVRRADGRRITVRRDGAGMLRRVG